MAPADARQFLLFLATGGFAAIVNFASRILYSEWLPYSPAIVVAYVTGMVTAFLLARAFVFPGSTRTVHASAVRFLAVNLVAVVQTWAVSVGLAFYLLPWLAIAWHPLEIAHFVGVAVPVFTSYVGHKHWSFR
jgi:putative flippase GtrA